MQSVKVLGNPILWGIAGLASTTIVTLIAVLLYVAPPGQKIIAFYADDVASIRSGISVRIAGVPVGKVKDLSIEPNRVRVRATVDREAFVGDQSQVQVRMLTVVGGYYVNVVSLGTDPLGTRIIPIEQVKTPYSLARTLADSTEITEGLYPKPINESLGELQHGLSGDNAEVLSTIVDAGNSVVAAIGKQRGQLTTILNMSDEYLYSISAYRDQLIDTVRKIAIFEQALTLYGKGLAGALSGLGDIGDRLLGPLGRFYSQHREKFLEKVHNWQVTARQWSEHNGLVVRGLRQVRDKIERVLDAQNAPPELLATDLCFPVAGGAC